MAASVLPAVLLGLAYAATPGVVNTECIRHGLRSGFRPAFSVQAGALAGDALWAVVALSGFAALAQVSSLSIALGLVGGLFFCKLAFAALRQATSPVSEGNPESAGSDPFRTGIVFGLANPAGLAFWAGVGGGFVAGSKGTSAGEIALFLVAFICGALVWSTAICALLSYGRQYARPRVFQVADAICGAVLGFFGVRLLWATGRRIARAV